MAEQHVQRRLSAVLVADVVGYSRLIEADEEGTRARLRSLQAEIIEPRTEADGGRIVKTTGDGILVEFPSAVAAVRNALAVQSAMAGRDSNLPENNRIRYRVGINLGDVIVEGDDIHGDGVNVAARLEGLCGPGEVYVSGTVHDHVVGKLAASFDDLGEQTVKNISKPVRVYRARDEIGEQTARTDADAAPPLSDKPSIAVLPFQNMSGDPEQEYFSDGITEDIITALSRIRQFFVIARHTTFTYKGQAADVQAVARDLGVRYVLEGSVRKSGDRVRITAQLIDGETGNHLWAERYDRDLEDIFAVQDEITLTVVGAIEPELSKAEIERARTKKPEDLGAWELYHRGTAHFYRRSHDDFVEAQRYFGRAVNTDPNFASAYSRSAITHHYNVVFGYSEAPNDERESAMAKAQKAIDLDPDDPFAYTILGLVSYVRRSESAIGALEKSLELNPSSAMTHSALGVALADIGRFEESFKHHDEALRLGQRDPTLPQIMARRCASQYWAGEYEAAVTGMNQVVSQPNAQLWVYYAVMAASLVKLGRIDEARNAARQVQELYPGITLKKVRESAYSGTENLERLIDDLRQAGLSDE